MRATRIAMVQMGALAGEPEQNLESMAGFAREASTEGARFVCFPELSISGYVRDSSSSSLAEPVPGPSTDRLVEIARDTGTILLAGLLEAGADGLVYNTHLVVSGSGLMGSYRKTHVAPVEAEGFAPGAELKVFTGDGLRLGLEICFDGHFPEASASLAQQGAEVLFIPHASAGETYTDKLERWIRFLPARAYDNAVYVAVCNLTGSNGRDLEFPGVTLVFDPRGRLIAQSTGSAPQIVYADLDPDALESARSDENGYFIPLRRPQLYAEQPSIGRGRGASDVPHAGDSGILDR